ncbi:MAG: hypothetical protein JSS36_02595 [Proteobacteria bacterium]|nr:hypothetical protein [Pseudomonadota bacterium]
MADQPPPVPQHFEPPSPRELRAQAVQRLQVGLFGVAVMLLVVALANIVMDRARQADAASGLAVASHAPSAASPAHNDPLADIGVAPAPDSARPRPRQPGH